jgi:hypothetical protein
VKYFPYIPVFIFIFLTFSGCEKVIEFDLADSKEMIVIEASIANRKDPFKVLVSKTTPYLQTGPKNQVSGAKVSIRTDKGKPIYFKETEPGVYILDNVYAPNNQWYNIDVEYEGITYTARSFMNELVSISDVYFSYFDGLGIMDSGYKIVCFIEDPANTENYYRIKYFINGDPVDDHGDLTIYSDKLINGKVIGLNQGSFVFKETDTLIIELQSIDKAAYNYFSTLNSISGIESLQSASPANPISNFNNGALGYFSAYSYERRRLIVKDYIKH